MKYLLCFLLCLPLCAQQNKYTGPWWISTGSVSAHAVGILITKPLGFTVEKLTPIEIEKLTRAQNALTKAKENLNRVTGQIKSAHGDTTVGDPNGDGQPFVVCPHIDRQVELRGDWALITTGPDPRCGAYPGGSK